MRTKNRLVESWLAEKRSAYLYRLLAKKEAPSGRGKLFAQLAQEAENQAKIWETQITKAGLSFRFRLDTRTLFVGGLIRLVSPRSLKMILAAIKIRGLSVYTEVFPGHPLPERVEDVGQRHATNQTAGNLRATVFGVNDGLVSNAALLLGFAGAGQDSHVISLAGISGLLAGACSMAAGEYVSVRSQREMYEHQIALEAEELKLYPEEEAAELALIYEARGMEKPDAETLAKKIISDPAKALDTLSREELGIDPGDLASAPQAALFSFVSFAIGAFIPLLPFLISSSSAAVVLCAVLAAATLFIVGMATSLFTGKSAIKGGLRMLAIGAVAGSITFAIGHLVG